MKKKQLDMQYKLEKKQLQQQELKLKMLKK